MDTRIDHAKNLIRILCLNELRTLLTELVEDSDESSADKFMIVCDEHSHVVLTPSGWTTPDTMIDSNSSSALLTDEITEAQD
ncbi:hypothetical protein [Halochromatium roseum]|uniref:hypothetical protein n=1 Tax=Halochromatium roseum TaxID=391920 RepID=UPI003083FE42